MTIQDQVLSSRINGILLPLAAMKTDTDWGVGDFSSLQEWTSFFASLGTKIIQILPLQETAPNETCPYSALSAFATDPVYTDISAVPDIKASPRAQEFIDSISFKIRDWHQAKKAPFFEVKQAKLKALWFGYQYFLETEAAANSPRFQTFEAYCAAQSGWLRGYALFRAIKEFFKWQTWTQWPEGLRNFDKTAVNAFEAQYREYVHYFSYIQWILDQQLRQAKVLAQQKGVLIFGDIPFGTNLDSAEVWSERANYRLGWEIGAPADA